MLKVLTLIVSTPVRARSYRCWHCLSASELDFVMTGDILFRLCRCQCASDLPSQPLTILCTTSACSFDSLERSPQTEGSNW